MRQVTWTLATLVGLGGVAAANPGESPGVDSSTVTLGVESRSQRGVAQDYLVLPSGGELGAQMRFITAPRGPIFEGEGEQKLEFTDLALFGVSARWSLFSKLELSASATLLPKQPAFTDEKPWQSVGVGLRSPLGRNAAVAVSGGGGHLMSHAGMWTRESLMLEWKKPIHEDFLSFDIQGGIQGLGIQAPKTTKSTAMITEVAIQTTALFREPHGKWGAWLGMGYAVPVQFSGKDPTTEMWINPQPRLDFHMGTVLALVPKWDLFVDFAVVDRGELSDPTTRLPILDGGFDQRQVIFGVTRHIEGSKARSYDDYGDDDGAIRVGTL
ncbi:MAG TPA: hypothetical protein VMZ53_14425 [Kofleriaceae bacterium]|nr:hypothetical protein [Kofleriaceae bacterium]